MNWIPTLEQIYDKYGLVPDSVTIKSDAKLISCLTFDGSLIESLHHNLNQSSVQDKTDLKLVAELKIDANYLDNMIELNPYTNLRFLDASMNRLTRLPTVLPSKLTTLNLSMNEIVSNESIDWGDIPLMKLDLSRNTRLKRIPSLSKYLTSLDVSGCLIEESDLTGLSEQCPLICSLSMSGCHLKSFPVSRFALLEVLLLSDNDLVEFEVNMHSLQKIKVDFNPRLKSISLNDCHNVKYMDISFTKISHVKGSFPLLIELKAIDTPIEGVSVHRYTSGSTEVSSLSKFCRYSTLKRDKLKVHYDRLSEEWSRLRTASPSSFLSYRKQVFFHLIHQMTVKQYNSIVSGNLFEVVNLDRSLATPFLSYTNAMIRKIRAVQNHFRSRKVKCANKESVISRDNEATRIHRPRYALKRSNVLRNRNVPNAQESVAQFFKKS